MTDTANHPSERQQLAREFIAFAIEADVLRFGRFETKAGRISPYFFNAGLFHDGDKLLRLAQFYARMLILDQVHFDLIFGPAYKGITLAAAVAMELARMGVNKPFAYNRKEVKKHGEGGQLVGAPLQGRVLIIDDVISAGTAVRQSIDLIQDADATPCAVAIALDRQEKAIENGRDLNSSAVDYVRNILNIDVHPIATLDNLLQHLRSLGKASEAYKAVADYRTRYGI